MTATKPRWRPTTRPPDNPQDFHDCANYVFNTHSSEYEECCLRTPQRSRSGPARTHATSASLCSRKKKRIQINLLAFDFNLSRSIFFSTFHVNPCEARVAQFRWCSLPVVCGFDYSNWYTNKFVFWTLLYYLAQVQGWTKWHIHVGEKRGFIGRSHAKFRSFFGVAKLLEHSTIGGETVELDKSIFLRRHPHAFFFDEKEFAIGVANRVACIQQLVDSNCHAYSSLLDKEEEEK